MFRLIPLSVLLLTLAIPAVAKDKKDSEAHGISAQKSAGGDVQGQFSSAERNLIRSWLLEDERHEMARHPPTGLPPGLQKKVAGGKALPPGWQKKLARGEHLDREYYGYGSPLPDDLMSRLPPPPPGSEILRIEDQIIRLDAATRIILDVFGLGGY